jgi:hypothetical protein
LAAERKSAVHQVAQRTPLHTSDRQDRDVKTAGNALSGIEIVVQGDDRVAELLAEMIDYANHAQWYAADPETRKYVQDVLATHGEAGGADRFRKYLYARKSGFDHDAARATSGKFAAVVECLTPLRMMQQVLRGE